MRERKNYSPIISTDEDMEQITKEWPKEFLVPVADAELSDTDIIGSPLVTRSSMSRQTSVKKKKKKEEVQDIETDEEDNTSEGKWIWLAHRRRRRQSKSRRRRG
jgi:hypothetical protein